MEFLRRMVLAMIALAALIATAAFLGGCSDSG
jgi:Na+/pantothenate symporter